MLIKVFNKRFNPEGRFPRFVFQDPTKQRSRSRRNKKTKTLFTISHTQQFKTSRILFLCCRSRFDFLRSLNIPSLHAPKSFLCSAGENLLSDVNADARLRDPFVFAPAFTFPGHLLITLHTNLVSSAST